MDSRQDEQVDAPWKSRPISRPIKFPGDGGLGATRTSMAGGAGVHNEKNAHLKLCIQIGDQDRAGREVPESTGVAGYGRAVFALLILWAPNGRDSRPFKWKRQSSNHSRARSNSAGASLVLKNDYRCRTALNVFLLQSDYCKDFFIS